MYIVVIAFVMVLLMRFLAAIIVWLIVALAAVGSLGLYDAFFLLTVVSCIILQI